MSGSLFIVTAASGTGKTSLVKELIATTDQLVVSVSHTTREPRVGEINGQHYHFVDAKTFINAIQAGDFLEHAEVFGNYYGTSKNTVQAQLDAGFDVILEIDWQGALQVKALFDTAEIDSAEAQHTQAQNVTMIFIMPPSKDALKQRLSNRGQDSTEVIERRLAGAVEEMQQYIHFDYLVINDDFNIALSELKSIIIADRQRTSRQQSRQQNIIASLLN